MKHKISFLAIIAMALNVNYVRASECIDDDCDLKPIVIEENINIDELSGPVKYEINVPAKDTSSETSCDYDYNCPFDTAAECDIWYTKPVYAASLEPRAPHINPVLVDDILYAIYSNYEITANDCAMSPLLERYKILMNASKSCCTSGIIYKMHADKLSDKDVYNFLKDDVNHFATTNRCMVMPNDDISHSYSYGVTGEMVADVRNSCLCKNREWFENLLQPFVDIYERAPQFESAPFVYTYTDGLQREITVSVNEDVQTALGLLSACPD